MSSQFLFPEDPPPAAPDKEAEKPTYGLEKPLDYPLRDQPVTFGWLHADMRVPLPPLDDLDSACHLIGQQNGHRMFLCTSKSQSEDRECDISSDFSKYYGAEVMVCRGQPV